MLKKSCWLALAGLALLAPAVHADDAAPAPTAVSAPVSPWKANAEIGYIDADTGGVSSTTFKGKLHGEYTDGAWTNEANADALSASSNAAGSADTERYLADTKSRRAFDVDDYVFVQNQWTKDLQSSYKYQLSTALGYGYYFLKNPVQELSVDLGVGFRHSEPTTAAPVNDGIGTLNGHYHWQINPAIGFGETVDVQDGRENLVAHSVTELKQAVTSALAFSLSYDYRHDSGGAGETDRITSFNLIYQFK